MFINNKYRTCYYNIINNAKNRPITGFVERHHIVPRSLGGSNDSENIVALTAREHFICHRLLCKFTIEPFRDKMTVAVWGMIVRNALKMRFTSRTYEQLRIENAKAVSRINKGREPWNKGKKIGSHSEERKKKISESVKIKMKELGYNVK